MSRRIYSNYETGERLKYYDIEGKLSPYTGYFDTRTMTEGLNFDDGEQLFYIYPGTKVFYDSDRSGSIYTFRAVSTIQPDKEYKFGINNFNQVFKQETVPNKHGYPEWGPREWSGGSSHRSMHTPTPRRTIGSSFDELAGTNHGNSSKSTRNRRPVSVPRNPPPSATRLYTKVRGATKRPGSSNTQTMRATHKLVRGGKRKTQKKRKSTKKRNNKKK